MCGGRTPKYIFSISQGKYISCENNIDPKKPSNYRIPKKTKGANPLILSKQ